MNDHEALIDVVNSTFRPSRHIEPANIALRFCLRNGMKKASAYHLYLMAVGKIKSDVHAHCYETIPGDYLDITPEEFDDIVCEVLTDVYGGEIEGYDPSLNEEDLTTISTLAAL